MKITRAAFYQFLFIACVVIPTFNNYELTFGVWFIAMLITLKHSYSLQFLKYLLTPLLIMVVAFVSAFWSEYKIYDYIRDITYLLKPILGLMVGYQLCKNVKNNRPFRLIVLTGFLLAIIHLCIVGFSVAFLHIRNMHELRALAGYFNDFEVYAFVILLFSSRFDLQVPAQKKMIVLAVIGFSIFLYLARTNFIQLVLLSLALMGYFRLNARAVTVIATMFLVTLVAYTAIYNSNPRRGSKGLEAFLYKVKIAPIEPFKTKINKEDWKDFNDNYRSYENIQTVRQVSGQGAKEILIGEGLGSRIDLGREIWTNDGEFIRYLPALHNSYMTIFLKSGLLGVLLLFVFVVQLFRQKRSEDKIVTSINYLLVGSAIFLILSNWVFMGLYFKVDTKSILLGYLICHRENLIRLIRPNRSLPKD